MIIEIPDGGRKGYRIVLKREEFEAWLGDAAQPRKDNCAHLLMRPGLMLLGCIKPDRHFKRGIG
jgi:hypothetical protein